MVAKHASLAQSAERVTFNHVVASSSLARGDFIFEVDPRVPMIFYAVFEYWCFESHIEYTFGGRSEYP